MAETKYAGLPGISYDQPDVYESEDLPEADQEVAYTGDQSDAVEKLSTNVRESFSRFQGHWLDTKKVDFSGKISHKKQTGYSSWNGPYELQAQGEKETLIQKFNRLKCEITELEEELVQAKDAKLDEKHSAMDLIGHVDHLHKQLLAMSVEEKAVPSLSSADPQGLAKKKLFSQIEQLLKAAPALASSGSGGATSSDSKNIIYELNYNPQKVKLETASKLSDLQKRLDKLEQILGANQEKMTRLSAETGQKSLADAVKSIHSKVSLLEPSHIDQVEARLSLLVQKLNAMSDKKMVLEDADKQGKVTEMYDLMKKMEPLTCLLPTVIDRLVTLQELHEGASNFAHSLTEVENTQGQLNGSLAAHSQLLKEVKEGLITNMNTIKKTVEQLESRLAALK